MPASLRIEVFPLDFEKSIRFYTEVLRFKLLRKENGYAYIQRDAVFIGIVPKHSLWTEKEIGPRHYSKPPTGVEIVIEVDNVEQERNLVRVSGWTLEADLKQQAWGLRDFRLLDPDGYYLRITEHGHGHSADHQPSPP